MLEEKQKTLSKNILGKSKKLNKKELRKQAGFSLQGMLIASLIGSLLAGATIISMWGSVDKATITAEMASVNAFKNAAAGILEANGSYPTALNAATDLVAQGKVSQMPKELKYQLILMEGLTAGTSDDWIALKAYADTQAGVDRLSAVAAELDLKIDGTAANTTGRFVYSLTCSAPTTAATSATDCYYVTPLLAKGNMPADIATGTTGNDKNGTPVAYNADTTAETDQRTNMN